MVLVLLVMLMLLSIGGSDGSTSEVMATVLYLGGSGHRVNVAVLVLLVMLFFIGSDVSLYDVINGDGPLPGWCRPPSQCQCLDVIGDVTFYWREGCLFA